MRFEVLVTVNIKITVFWEAMPGRPVVLNLCETAAR
jgi:hypothetical protein